MNQKFKYSYKIFLSVGVKILSNTNQQNNRLIRFHAWSLWQFSSLFSFFDNLVLDIQSLHLFSFLISFNVSCKIHVFFPSFLGKKKKSLKYKRFRNKGSQGRELHAPREFISCPWVIPFYFLLVLKTPCWPDFWLKVDLGWAES